MPDANYEVIDSRDCSRSLFSSIEGVFYFFDRQLISIKAEGYDMKINSEGNFFSGKSDAVFVFTKGDECFTLEVKKIK